MLTATIAGATFSGVLGAYVVQKIFFTLSGVFTYLYLFLTVSGSFDIKSTSFTRNPWATAVLIIGGIAVIYVVLRRCGRRSSSGGTRRRGGAILAQPRTYLARVFLPSGISCSLASA